MLLPLAPCARRRTGRSPFSGRLDRSRSPRVPCQKSFLAVFACKHHSWDHRAFIFTLPNSVAFSLHKLFVLFTIRYCKRYRYEFLSMVMGAVYSFESASYYSGPAPVVYCFVLSSHSKLVSAYNHEESFPSYQPSLCR